MSFGWSAGDIFTLVVTCYKIVDTCRAGLTGASLQLSGLQNDLEEFSAVLLHLHDVVKESRNIAFFDMKEMKKTIEACNIYLTKYAGLKRKASFSKGKELLDNAKDAGLKIKQAVIYTTLGGDQELQVLQRRLARHRQTLVLYLQILERNRRTKEDIKLNKRLSDMEAMVKDMHSVRRLSAIGSPDYVQRSPRIQEHQQRQDETDSEDYEAIFKALNEQKRLALMETKRPNNDDNLEEWNDILDHLEIISRRVLNAAERTASSTAQRRTGSVSHQIALNRMLTPHHTMGTPPLRPIQRVDTHDSGFAEMLPPALAPVREESSGLTEGFVESGHVVNKYVHPSSSFSEGMVEHHRPPISPRSLMKSRTLSVHSIHRPVISPSSSSESVAPSTVPTTHSPRQSRTFSMSSSEVSVNSAVLLWQVIQFDGWVKCCTKTSRKPLPCSIHGGYDSNGQVYGLHIRRQDTNDPLVFIKLSTKKKRPVPQVEPSGERDDVNEGFQAYFIGPIDTEPKDEEVQFFFKEEKSLNKFESLVYGQELLLTINIRKISSSGKTLSESQRLRLWRKGDTKSLLFYPTCEKTKGRYHPVLAREVHQAKQSKTSLDLKLQDNSHHLKDLKIEFENKPG
ncbi:hypothetical protein TMatcc_007970 [Talaromyces marneffei ATCC 18224]|uniref:Fungal N-terminal domain-containing protein n=2 Tax=Talaromyces marneffei TaxID=37727 RepID=B6QDW0_TALMQ|nr:hypothetical protein PMAA_088420 [Talaromyces marneffei ATCC 18224]